MRFSTFHAFMLQDAKEVADDHLLEGRRLAGGHRAVIDDEVALICEADELGFDGCWVREHHFTDYGFLPNTMALLAHVAARTERIRLGTAVVTLPLHHPVRAAEDVALVDVLSGGRIDVGVGRGYQSVEFDVLGVPLAEARSRTDEAIAVMRALWSSPEPVSHRGRHWSFDDVGIQPQPIQRPHPPLYYASINPDSITHYAAQGIPFIVDSNVTISALAGFADTWRGVAAAHGYDPHGAELVALRYVWLDDSDEAARDYVARVPRVTSLATDPRLHPRLPDGTVAPGYEYWEKGWHGHTLDYYDAEPNWDDRWIAGSPERVIDQLRALEGMGIGNVCCVFGLEPTAPDRAEISRRMRRFASEVMPAFAGSPQRPAWSDPR